LARGEGDDANEISPESMAHPGYSVPGEHRQSQFSLADLNGSLARLNQVQLRIWSFLPGKTPLLDWDKV